MSGAVSKEFPGWRLHPVWYIIILAFIARLGWALVIPFNEGNDEYVHYQQVRFIYDALRLPVFGPEQDLFVCNYGIHYAAFPGLNYILSALWMLIVPAAPEHQYIVARLTSVFCGTITVAVGWLVAGKLFPGRPAVTLGVPVFLAFLPGFVFISVYVNSDAYTAFTASLVLYALLMGTERCWDGKSSLLLGLAVGLVALGKYNGYAVIPVAALFILWTMRQNIRGILRIFFISAITAFAVCGWWFVRSYYLYGDVLGSGDTGQAGEILGWTERSLKAQGLDAWEAVVQTDWLSWLFKSFWGVFGHMNVLLPVVFYWLAAIFTVFMFYVLARRFITQVLKGRQYSATIPGKTLFVYVLFIFLLLGLVVYACYNNDYQPQGRYLYPAIVPVSLFMVLGLDIFTRNWPQKFKNGFLLGTAAGLFLLCGIILLIYIGPIYYIR